jgi:hypothetical protein
MKKMGLMVSINSNGSMLEGEILEKLLADPPVRMNISLYGGCEETYQNMCGLPMYERVLNNIIRLKEAGVSISLNLSITPYNCQDLEKIYEIVDKHQINVRASSYMYPPIRLEKEVEGYGNRLSPEESANYFIELQNASDADFQKFNQTLTELALKEKEYSDIQQQTEEILTEKVANIAQAINQISTNGIKINGYYTGLANAGNSMQQATLNTAALEQGMTTMVTAMMGMSKKFDAMSGDLVTTLDDFSQEVSSALNKVGISIDGREFGRIVRQYV